MRGIGVCWGLSVCHIYTCITLVSFPYGDKSCSAQVLPCPWLYRSLVRHICPLSVTDSASCLFSLSCPDEILWHRPRIVHWKLLQGVQCSADLRVPARGPLRGRMFLLCYSTLAVLLGTLSIWRTVFTGGILLCQWCHCSGVCCMSGFFFSFCQVSLQFDQDWRKQLARRAIKSAAKQAQVVLNVLHCGLLSRNHWLCRE